MHIAIDIRSLSDGVGGVTEYTRAVVRSLLALEDLHTYILFTNSWKGLQDFGFPKTGPRHSTVELRYPNKLFHASQMVLGRPHIDALIERRTGKRPDVIFFPNIHFASHSQSVPAVLTLHDLSFLIHPELLSFKSLWWHRLIAPRKFIARMVQVLAVSDCTQQDCALLCERDMQSITVTHLGRNPLLCSQDSAQVKSLSERTSIVLFGAHEMRKNALAAVEAFALFCKKDQAARRYTLVLVGRDGALFNKLRRRSEELTIEGSVEFRALCSDGDRINLTASARLLMYPSIYEGFGLPLLEAACASVPIISSCRASIGEVISDGALLVDPCNVHDIATALSFFISSESAEESELMVQRAHQIAHTYSWTKTAELTRSVLEKCGQTEGVCV